MIQTGVLYDVLFYFIELLELLYLVACYYLQVYSSNLSITRVGLKIQRSVMCFHFQSLFFIPSRSLYNSQARYRYRSCDCDNLSINMCMYMQCKPCSIYTQGRKEGRTGGQGFKPRYLRPTYKKIIVILSFQYDFKLCYYDSSVRNGTLSVQTYFCFIIR